MDRTRASDGIATSVISFAFLAGFLLSTTLLQWWQSADYPLFVWETGIVVAVGGIGLGVGLGRRVPLLLGTAALGSLIAFAAVARTTHVPTNLTVDTYATGSSAIITGKIADAPDRRSDFVRYTVATESIRASLTGAVTPVTGFVLVKDTAMWPAYAYGQTIEVAGILEKPEQIDDFAYDQYLSRYGIYALQNARRITPLTQTDNGTIYGALIAMRETVERRITLLLPEPQASFLMGLLTGSRRGMPEHLTENFKITGLSHIVAISGFNITIIISILGTFLFFLPLRWRFIPSVAAIVAFTLFVGSSASVVRASVMGILGLVALQAGRLNHARLAILWTAFFMLLWNPKYLWYDAGFQLSFLAVLGLTETGDILMRWLRKVPEALGIREGLAMTLSAQVFAVPWIISLFGTMSLISPVANILVAPFIPLSMLTGTLAVLGSWIWFPLGQLFGYATWLLLAAVIVFCDVLARVPYASVTLPAIGKGITLLYYAVLIGLLVRHYRRSPPVPIDGDGSARG